MSTLSFLKEVFIVTITSFGGQSGHLLTFIKRFAEKTKFYTKEDILNLHSFCSLLPGATSTQLLCLIAYKKGGIRLSMLSLLIWITPISILMFTLAVILHKYNLIYQTDKIFAFFQPMILAFMLSAALKIKSRYVSDTTNISILIIATLTFLIFFKHPFIIPFVFLFSGLFTHKKSAGKVSTLFSLKISDINLNKRLLLLLISVLLFSAFTSEFSRKFETKNRYIFNLIEHNIRHGSIIYGGGDVLVPMMYEQYITRPTASFIKKRNPEVLTINKAELMAGAGLIRLMPGPVFSLVSFTTPLIVNEYNFAKQSFATLLATLSIYLPGILIILILFPLWDKISISIAYAEFLKGINLTVSALIFASTIYLSFDLTRHSTNTSLLFCQFLSGYSILHVLRKFESNHATIAIFCLFLGILYQCL